MNNINSKNNCSSRYDYCIILTLAKQFICFLIAVMMLFNTNTLILTQATNYSSSIYELRYHKIYQELKRQNNDVFGWITIPDTKINYPLVQGEDNDFYLHHRPTQKKNYRGSIFLDYRNNSSLINDNTILYGHNIQESDEMFSTLLSYEDQSFYESQPYIIIALDNEIRYYKIFASYTTHTNFYYIRTNFNNKHSLANLIDDIHLRNRLTSLVSYQIDQRILTLSTCSFRFESARFVVHASLVDVREVPTS